MGEHKGLCLRNSYSNFQRVEVSARKDFDFGEALESVHPILEMIFRYLSCKDLKSCGSVKNSWELVAQKVVQKRINPCWFTFCKIMNPNTFKYTEERFKSSGGLTYNNIDIGIIICPTDRTSDRSICLHTNLIESEKSVLELLEEEILSAGVEYCILSCPAIESYFDENVYKTRHSQIMDGFFIPKIKNIRTGMFSCNVTEKEDMENSIRPFIKPNEEVKCLLLFTTKDLKKSLFNLLKYLIPGDDPSSVPVGGGIIRETEHFQSLIKGTKRVDTGNDIFCITFLKDKDVQADFSACSFVIHGDISKKKIIQELKELRLEMILRTHSVCIKIVSSNKMDVVNESEIFVDIFPNTPLLGFDADGEIGWDSFGDSDNDTDDDEATTSKRQKQDYPKVQHQQSTVFVILSWGPKI